MRRRIGLGPRGRVAGLLAGLALLSAAPSIAEATVFRLTGADVVIDQPAPLFTSDAVTGTLTLDDSIAPGQSFGSSALTALTLDFGGVIGTLADVQADIAPGPVQIFGTRSADGQGFSALDFRFGFAPNTPGCSFVCAGQIIVNSPLGPNDPSNFIALDDFNGDSLSVISSYIPQFAQVPEPGAWTMMLIGLGLVGFTARRHRRGGGSAPSTHASHGVDRNEPVAKMRTA